MHDNCPTRLVGDLSSAYSYDPTGNRLTFLDAAARTTYVYDAANQLQTEKLGGAITSYTYDQNGNRASHTTGAAITSYTWDEENRLTGIAYADTTRTTYLYSADGLRQRKIDSTGTVNYLWDEGRVQKELNENLVEIVRYTQSIWGLDSLISQYRGGVTSFYGYDLAGNTRQLVDLAGNVTDTYIYETFGAIRTRTSTTINNFDFGGQWGYIRDEATRLYVRARHLDTARGNWISRDPIGFWGGDANLRRYVGNDPVSGVDPTGRAPSICAILVGVGAVTVGVTCYTACTLITKNPFVCVSLAVTCGGWSAAAFYRRFCPVPTPPPPPGTALGPRLQPPSPGVTTGSRFPTPTACPSPTATPTTTTGQCNEPGAVYDPACNKNAPTKVGTPGPCDDLEGTAADDCLTKQIGSDRLPPAR